MPGSESDPRPVDVGARRERGVVGLVDLAPGAGAVAGEALGLLPDDPRDRRIAGQPERLLALEEALIDADAVAQIGDRALLRQRLGDVRGRLAAPASPCGSPDRARRRPLRPRTGTHRRRCRGSGRGSCPARTAAVLRPLPSRCRRRSTSMTYRRRRPREERGECGNECGGEKHLNGCVVVVHVPFPPRPFDHGWDGTRARGGASFAADAQGV